MVVIQPADRAIMAAVHTSRRFWILIPAALFAVAASTATAQQPAPDAGVQQRLQAVVDRAVATPDSTIPGSILHYRNSVQATWSVAAGKGDLKGAAMRPDDKFFAGSILKTFIAVVTLQHVEE